MVVISAIRSSVLHERKDLDEGKQTKADPRESDNNLEDATLETSPTKEARWPFVSGDGGADEPHDPEQKVPTKLVAEAWMARPRAIMMVVYMARSRIARGRTAISRSLTDYFIDSIRNPEYSEDGRDKEFYDDLIKETEGLPCFVDAECSETEQGYRGKPEENIEGDAVVSVRRCASSESH